MRSTRTMLACATVAALAATQTGCIGLDLPRHNGVEDLGVLSVEITRKLGAPDASASVIADGLLSLAAALTPGAMPDEPLAFVNGRAIDVFNIDGNGTPISAVNPPGVYTIELVREGTRESAPLTPPAGSLIQSHTDGATLKRGQIVVTWTVLADSSPAALQANDTILIEIESVREEVRDGQIFVLRGAATKFALPSDGTVVFTSADLSDVESGPVTLRLTHQRFLESPELDVFLHANVVDSRGMVLVD